jgi:hypothetical protein
VHGTFAENVASVMAEIYVKAVFFAFLSVGSGEDVMFVQRIGSPVPAAQKAVPIIFHVLHPILIS